MKKLDTKKLGMDILIDIIGGILIAIERTILLLWQSSRW